MRVFLAALLAILAAGCANIAPSPHGYEIVAKYFVGGPGGWDYVSIDEKRHHLFVGRTDRVQVIDTGTGRVVGELALGGVHGVAIAQELGLGFTSNGRTDSVTVFDLATLAVIDTVKVTGKNPDAILYEPLSRRVLTFNGGSANVTVIDAASRKVVGTISVSGKPEFAVADERGRVFVNIEDKNSLAVIDPASLKVSSEWPLAGCDEPTGLDIDRAAGRLFSVCGNRKMMVIDSKGGEIVATLPIGASVDGVVFDAAKDLTFSSNGEGTVTIVRKDRAGHYGVLGNLETQRSARTIALESSTHRLYLPAASYAPAAGPAPGQPSPRPSMIEDSFVILVLAPG
ncbi:MAG TPA: hypothetical protein VLH12_12790 [Usitatibacter sp.]|nr:hypothetical protein [Usitatibacter sp.]